MSNRINYFRRLLFWGLWGVAWAPALILALVIRTYSVPVPYHDSWLYVQDYRDWQEGHYSWAQWLKPNNMHPTAVGKLIYFAVLHWFRGNTAILLGLSWLFSLGVVIGILALARRRWRQGELSGPALLAVVNLVVFSGVQAGSWLWDYLYQNYIPGCMLALGLWVIATRWPVTLRLILVGLMSLIASYSFGSGFTVGFLFLPALWLATGSERLSRRLLVIGAAGVFFALVTWLVLKGPGQGHGTSEGMTLMENSSGDSIDRPWMRVGYVLAVLGNGLGRGFPVDEQILCPLFGGLMVLVLLGCLPAVWRRRREPGWLAAIYPWLAFCGFGVANAAMICFGRMRNSLYTALIPRYVTFSLFFTLGVLLLVVELSLPAKDSELSEPSRARRPWRPVMLALLAFTLCINSAYGWNGLLWFHDRLMQNRAAMMFADVLPLPHPRFRQIDDKDMTTQLVRYLHQTHKLFGVKFVKGKRIADFQRRPELSERWAAFDRLQANDQRGFTAKGFCALSKMGDELPDLVLITATVPGAEETIAAFILPEDPEDFYAPTADTRGYIEHYGQWEIALKRAELPVAPKVTLRAYGFVGDTQRVHPMTGQFEVDTTAGSAALVGTKS